MYTITKLLPLTTCIPFSCADKGISRVFSDAFSFVDSALQACGRDNTNNNNNNGEITLCDESGGREFNKNRPRAACPLSTDTSSECPRAGDDCAQTFCSGPNRVLIHCANGSNRSATITMAILMHRLGILLT